MADHHQLVDQIRAFVQSSDQTRNALLESLASTYAEACVDVNQRMGRCHRLFQQGLRSEAIQLAESEPKLLESLAALDFPERADWDELVQIYQLGRGPEARGRTGAISQRGLCPGRPAPGLVRMHRRLALQRAPIKSRIAVMRKLAAQDTNNPIWTDDLRTFEKARFRQVQSEAAEAAQNRNVVTISQLLPKSNNRHGSSRRRRRWSKHSGKPMRNSEVSRHGLSSTIWMPGSTTHSPPATRSGAGWRARSGSR